MHRDIRRTVRVRVRNPAEPVPPNRLVRPLSGLCLASLDRSATVESADRGNSDIAPCAFTWLSCDVRRGRRGLGRHRSLRAVSAWRGGQPALGVARPMTLPRRAGLYIPRTDSREADAVRKLTFGMNLSLDGYIAAPGDDIGWSVPAMSCSSGGPTGWVRRAWRCTGANCGRR